MNQLVAFRDGRRRYPPMNYLPEYQTARYLQKSPSISAALRPAAGAAAGNRRQCGRARARKDIGN